MIYRMALLGVALAAVPAAAQTDFRSLERGRPAGVEDAYPVERYGFELAGGYRMTRIGAGRVEQLFEPELSYGLGASLEMGFGALIAITDRAVGNFVGLAGIRLSGKYNLTTERPWLPGLALRLEAAIPVGNDAGSGAAVFGSILATRTLGRNRLHMNAGWSVGRPSIPALVEPQPEWRAGLALDHTLLRTSTLLILDVAIEKEWQDSDVAIRPGAGFRRQLTPMLVLDGGVRLDPVSVTIGFSRAFGIAGLMPGGGR